MKYKLSIQVCLLSIFMVAIHPNCYAFFGEGLDIWEQQDQYVELVPWDLTRSKRNDHPVEVDVKRLAVALDDMTALDKNSGKTRKIFSKLQSSALASYISGGLSRANSKLDIVFVVNDDYRSGAYISGRLFYVDGRLNFIFGSPDGKPGLRAKSASNYFFVAESSGIKHAADREDWLILDYALIAYDIEVERLKAEMGSNSSIENKSQKQYVAAQQEIAEALLKIKELQQENADLKKKLRNLQKNGRVKNELGVEERLTKLKRLFEADLIAEDEYNGKRTSILNDL